MAAIGEKPFTLEVITPERTVLREEVLSLRVPVLHGSVGILARHAPLVAPIAPGVAHLHRRDGSLRYLALTEGFLHVGGNRARILVEAGENPEEIDLDRVRRSAARAQERLQKARHGERIDVSRAQRALDRARARELAKSLGSERPGR